MLRPCATDRGGWAEGRERVRAPEGCPAFAMQHGADDPSSVPMMVDVRRERDRPEDLLLERLVDRQKRERPERHGKAVDWIPRAGNSWLRPGPGLALGTGTGAAKGVPSELRRGVQDESGDERRDPRRGERHARTRRAPCS